MLQSYLINTPPKQIVAKALIDLQGDYGLKIGKLQDLKDPVQGSAHVAYSSRCRHYLSLLGPFRIGMSEKSA